MAARSRATPPTYFSNGLKGRAEEDKFDDDHVLAANMYVLDMMDDSGRIIREEVPMRNALNEVLRDWYVGDCQAGVDRWNKRVLEAHGMSERITLPSRRFNRKVGVYAGKHFDPFGNSLTAEEWERKKYEWLPSPGRQGVPAQHPGHAGLQAGPVRELHCAAAARHQPAADRLRVCENRSLATETQRHRGFFDERTKGSVRGGSGIATITLIDPPANTYSYEMMQELDAAVLAARMDAAVHVIVITGAGEKFFCAGANIGMLKDADPTFKYYFCLHANETLNRLEQTPKLVIAALNGHTVGGGLEVAHGRRHPHRAPGRRQDRHARSRAGRAARHGRHAALRAARRQGQGDRDDGDGIAVLVRRSARTSGSSTTSGASELNGGGFADKVHDYAKQFTPPSKAAKAVGHIKRAVQSGLESGFTEGLALERELQQRLFESDDAKEGLKANLEKRKPDFSGR